MEIGTILFVSDRESFIVKSIIKNVVEAAIPCVFCTLSIDKLKTVRDKLGAFVYLYVDDKNDIEESDITYLRDICTDADSELYVIGYREDIAQLKESVFHGGLAGEYYRPINAGQISQEIIRRADIEMVVGHKRHILVVDDSGIMLTTIKGWLEDKYRITLVNSAMGAINFLSKEKPDLILLDYEMPVCSGPKLLEMIRTDSDGSDVPVIFLTAKDDAASVRSVLSLRPSGYLLKSLPKEKIISEIDLFFEKEKAKKV